MMSKQQQHTAGPIGVIILADGRRVSVRPSLPQDIDLLRAFFHALSDQARYGRFLTKLGELSESMARRFADIDHLRHVALLACATIAGSQTVVGEARYILSTEDAGSAEFAIAVAGDWQGLGLARGLLARLSGHAAAAGIRRLVADTLAGNAAMLELARAYGFTVSENGADRRLLRLVKELSPKAQRRPLQRFAVPAQRELHCSQGG
jgi:GNAT superfamily N-acetyltransferase